MGYHFGMLLPRACGTIPALRRWVLVVTFVAATLIGLLGMHTLTTGHSGAIGAASASGHVHVDARSAGHTAAGHTADTHLAAHDPGCATCAGAGAGANDDIEHTVVETASVTALIPSESHDVHDALLACAIGLLVFILLARIAAPRMSGARAGGIPNLIPRSPAPCAPLRPPSLRDLCISRT